MDRFKSNKKTIIETHSLASIISIIENSAYEKLCHLIYGSSGYGVSEALNCCKKKWKKNILLINTSNHLTYKNLLISILHQTNTYYPGVDLTSSRIYDLNIAVFHLLKSEHESSTILILNINSYVSAGFLRSLEDLIKELKGICSLIIRLNPLKVKPKELNDFVKRTYFKKHFRALAPEYEEKYAICQEIGILNEEIIDKIVRKSHNLHELYSLIDQLRSNILRSIIR